MPEISSNLNTRVSLLSLGIHVIPPLSVSLASYLLSPNDITGIQLTLGFVLLQIPWASYLNWRKTVKDTFPIFALISFMYWIYYGVSLFWGGRTVSGGATQFEALVSQDSITWSLALAALGISVIWLGMNLKLGNRLVPKMKPALNPGNRSLHYVRLLLVLGTLLSLWEGFPYIAGEGGRQALTIIASTVPVLAFAILLRNQVVGKAELIDKVLVLAFILLRLLIGLSSGWLGSFASIILVCAAVFATEKRKIPRFALVLVACFILFFQVGKAEFRRLYWYQDAQTSKIDRARFWTDTSLSKWQDAASDSTGQALADSMNTTFSRVSLLTQSANVLELTPSTIPYQGGQLYSYLALTWIPRVLWPDKPSMSEANRFYQVTYGLSTQEGLETVAIGVGVMTEAYISFGWYGVLGVMFLMGVFYDAYRRMFFSHRSGLLMTAVGIALLPQMIGIESQMAAYLGGLAQQIVFTLIIFSPIIRWRRQEPEANWHSIMSTITPGRVGRDREVVRS